MTANELLVILDRHKRWLNGKDGGSRADLRDADLRGADLRDADLRGADLCGADLRDADLCGADLRDADLRDADLRRAHDLPDLFWTSIVPESGAFVGWKKVYKKASCA